MSRVGLLSLWLFGALAWLAAELGCDPAEMVASPDGGVPSGGGAPYDAGHGDADADALGGNAPLPDAGQLSVLLGLEPNPRGTGGAAPTAADQLEAQLTTYAVGVRSVVLSVPWAELYGQPIDGLTAAINEFRAMDLSVVLNLQLVDRELDHRPQALAGLDWDDGEVADALETTLDDVLGPHDQHLHALVLSREADVYLDAHPAEAAALTELHATAIDHIAAHAGSRPATGVGLTYIGGSPGAPYLGLLALGERAVWSYQPGLGSTQVPTDVSPAQALDTMIGLAAARPIILLAAGLTSHDELGGSEEGQQLFFDSLFGAVASRRAHFDVIHVHELHDRAGQQCDLLVASRGMPPDSPFEQFVCQSGLKAVDGTAKPAWTSFVQGAAAFASP